VDPRDSLDDLKKRKFLALPGLGTPTPWSSSPAPTTVSVLMKNHLLGHDEARSDRIAPTRRGSRGCTLCEFEIVRYIIKTNILIKPDIISEVLK
jgi:hypothetical protein